MTLVEAIVVLVAYFAACWVFSRVLKRGLIGILFFKAGVALRKKLPIGVYRWDRPDSISVGKPDTVVVFKMPFRPAPDRRSATHVAVSDSTTRFSVEGEPVEVDPFLEAYDAEIGPLVVHVQEVGRIATIGIASVSVAPDESVESTASDRARG